MRTSHLNFKFRAQTCTVLISIIRMRVWILWTRLFSIVAEDNSRESVQTNYQRRKKRIAGRRILDKSSKEFFLCVISIGLLYCKVDAAVRHHTGTSSTEWRYGKRCKGQKIYTCYILRVCGVFSLLFPQCQCLVLFLPRPLVKLPCYLIYGILHWLLCISIHPSILDLLLEDETHLTNCYGSYTSKYPCDWLVRNKKELIQNIFLWWKKPFHQYSWKNDTY